MARLIVHPGTPQAWEISLKEGRTLIGRGEHNHFRIPDGSVSTSHCEIFVEGGAVRLKDLGSTNGTQVERARVTETILLAGQTIRLGSVELIFEAGAAQEPQAAQQQVVQLAPKIEGSVITLVAAPPESQPKPPTATAATPPIPIAPRLQVSKTHAPAAVAPAPVVEAPSPPQMPPPAASSPHAISVGAVACKFHPKAAAQFMCNKCKKYFCAVCVMTRGAGAAAQHLCRTCGVDCVPVKSSFVSTKTEGAKVYSDSAVLIRSIGFGVGAAVLVALLWGGFAWLTQFDVVFIFAAVAGAACGYAVKIGSQDRPGAVFSTIAISSCLLAILLGKIGASLAGVLLWSDFTKFLTDVLGLIVGGFLAWWLSGGDV